MVVSDNGAERQQNMLAGQKMNITGTELGQISGLYGEQVKRQELIFDSGQAYMRPLPLRYEMNNPDTYFF